MTTWILISPFSLPPLIAGVFFNPLFGLLGILPASSLSLVPEVARTLDGLPGTLLGGGIAIEAEEALLATVLAVGIVGLRDMVAV
jgi:hypothetical protein